MIVLFFRRWLSLHHKPAVRVSTAILIALLLNLVFGALFLLAESKTQPELRFWDAVWWSMVTMTTVGYGDFFPKSFAGRFFVAYPCLILGIGLIGYSLGVIAESMIAAFNQRNKGKATMRFKDHLVICQCPSIPRILRLVAQFRAAHADPRRPAVVVTSRFDEMPVEFREHSIDLVNGLSTSEETLTRAGVATAAGVMVLAHDPLDQSSDAESFTAGTLVKLIEEDGTRPINLVIEVADRKNLRMMERVGASGIVPVEGVTDLLLMQEMMNPGLRSLFEDIISYTHGSEFYIMPHRFAGRLLCEIQIAAIRHPGNLQIIGVVRDGATLMVAEKSFALCDTDKLIILADKRSDFQDFENLHLSKSPLPDHA